MIPVTFKTYFIFDKNWVETVNDCSSYIVGMINVSKIIQTQSVGYMAIVECVDAG